MEKSEDETNTDNNAYNSIGDDTIDENIYAPKSSCKGIENWTQENSPLPCSKTDFTRIIRRKGMYLNKCCIDAFHMLYQLSSYHFAHFSQADTTALSSGLVLRMALQPVSCSWSPSPPPPPPPPPPAAPAPPPCSASMSSTWCCGWCCGKKYCKILFRAHISTWLEKLWGCCCMVTVMFSCQELPGWSVPGLLFAFLKKILFLTLYVGKSNPITIAIFMFSEALVSDHLWRYVLTSVND